MTDSMTFLDIQGAAKTFGGTTVLDGVDLTVARGEFISLLGPSGCGKTTLLRIVAGLLTGDRGTVTLDGEEISRKPPHHRDVGVVFQSYALFPHLTVAENVAFGLEARGAPKAEIEATVRRFLDLAHMASFADRSVKMLSGGQQQRVAVARALAVQPKLLLLDEPFSALDRKLRETMQIELKRLLRELNITAIFVTHDQDEALVMSDRIAVMNRGQIEQLADPETIYRRPATPFALEFVGLSTRIAGKVAEATPDGVVAIDTAYGRIRANGRYTPGSPVLVGIRPERMAFGPNAAENTIKVTLTDIVFQGSRIQAHFASSEDRPIQIESSETVPAGLSPGGETEVSWNIADTLLYPDVAA